MKFFYFFLLLIVPLTTQAWDRSSYDYKTGRATKMTQDYSLQSSETIRYSSATPHCPNKQEHDLNVFQRLGDSFSVDIPDPSDALQNIIETTPNYF